MTPVSKTRSPSVTVFCSASESLEAHHYELAREMGRCLAEAGFRVVYGGGRLGMMGALADGALAAGAEVVGIIPKALEDREVAHTGLTILEVCPDLMTRKDRLLSLADMVLVLPGGLGTVDEFLEAITHRSLGFHGKMTLVLNHRDFYSPLLAWLEDLQRDGFIRGTDQVFEVTSSIEETLEKARLLLSEDP